MRGRARSILVGMFALSGCGLLASADRPAGYFDLDLLARDPTAAVRDYVRRTPDEGIAPEDVLTGYISASIDYGNPVVATERFRGVPVIEAWREFSVDQKTGAVIGRRDRWVRLSGGVTIVPAISADAAREIGIAAWPEATSASCNAASDLAFHRIDEANARLAWTVRVIRAGFPLGRCMLVDAQNGAIFSDDTFEFGNN
jgi:hypothetical protein